MRTGNSAFPLHVSPIARLLAVLMTMLLAAPALAQAHTSAAPGVRAQLRRDVRRVHEELRHDARQLRAGVHQDVYRARRGLHRAAHAWHADLRRADDGMHRWWHHVRSRTARTAPPHRRARRAQPV